MDTTRSTLLARLRDRSDDTAWRTFDALYRPMLVGYARHRGLGQADAEDVAQQCVEAVLKQIDDYEHHGSFKAWLRTITERRICDVYRRRRDHQVDTGVWAAKSGDAAGPRTEWDRQWRLAHFRHSAEKARAQVTPETWQAFVEYAVKGRAAETVAKELGISVSAIYVTKHRILGRIGEVMRELTGGEVPDETDDDVS